MALVVVGLNLAVQQGDFKTSHYLHGAKFEDYDNIKEGYEAGTEFSVIGCSPVYRESTYLDKTMVIQPGSDAVKCKKGVLILSREAAGVQVMPLYLEMMIPDSEAKLTAIKTAFVGKTIAGAEVTAVSRKLNDVL